MSYKAFCLQILVEGVWINYELCRTIERALELVRQEVPGQRFRILGYDSKRNWIELLISGSMLSLPENTRMLSLVGW